MNDCESFQSAKAVSIEYKKLTHSWELNISWIPHPSEGQCLEKIVIKHDLEMVTSGERTIFRSKSKA
ncbi:MAG TPA: hypothetical protein VLU95_03360 [Candidatus Acidoferrum sp.]|nr:hypothetical protein [Candidatus Acidoferrum sp.]